MQLSKLKRFMPGKPTQIIVGAIVVVVLLMSTRSRETPEPRSERAWSVQVIDATPATLRPTLELFGQVQSPQDSELSAAVEAVVAERLARDGDSVEAGDVLVVLDDRDARLELQQNAADLKEANAQQNFARIRLSRSKQAFEKEKELLDINVDRSKRAEEVFAEGLLSNSDMDTASENLTRQQLAVNQAELNVEENAAKLTELEAKIARTTALRDRAALDLERTRIKAPFSGVISDMQVSEGDRVRVGDPLMRLQNPESIEVRAQLPTRVARSISESLEEGTIISAMVDADGRAVTGKLLRVSGQTNLGSGGVDSFIGFESNMVGLRLGATVRVLMELPPEANVIAVPGEAVYGADRIYKLNGDRMQMLTIERVGEREYEDGRTEVLLRTPELSDADQIIVTKLANASDGLLVNPDVSTAAADFNTTATADAEPPADK